MRRIRIFILVLFLMLTACQPTPKEPFVIGKDNERLIEKAKGSAEPAQAGSSLYDQLGCPRTYVLDLKNEATRVRIRGEAPVILPEADALPLVYVQAARFDQETVYAFFRTLTAGEEMFDIPTEAPKWYVEEEIRKEQAKLDEMIATRGEDDGTVKLYRDMIRGMQDGYLTAPEEVTLIPNDGTLKPFDMVFMGKNRATAMGVQATSYPFSGRDEARFTVTNDADYADAGSYTFTDENGNEQGFSPNSGSLLLWYRGPMVGTSGSALLLDVTAQSLTGEAARLPEGLTLEGYLEPEKLLLSLTPAEARRQAERLMETCSVADMVADGVYLMSDRQEMYGIEYWHPADVAELRDRPEHQAYVVRFLRQVAGVPVEGYSGSGQVRVDDAGYGPEWHYEVLEVAVNDEGISSVEWIAPLFVEESITDRAALLPFEEVRGIFERMLPIVYANYGVDKDWEIEIDHVRLCLWRIFDRDSFTRGILTPVWCFYGQVNGYSDTMFQPLLILNAVDGSIIDPHIGY